MNSVLNEWAAARRALAERASASVVSIDRGKGSRVSGIVWSAGTVVAAAESLHGADAVTVHSAKESVPAEILACDLAVDVAVLRANLSAPDLSSAAPSPLSSGDEVLILGHAPAGPAILWTGVEQVGPAWQSRSGGQIDQLIRLSATLHPALEGSGVFDLEGRLCAMAVRGPRHSTLGIPRETIERTVATVLQHGRLPQPYIGVRLQQVSLDRSLREQLSRTGAEAVIVVGVEPDSPAATTLLFGDLILSFAGQPIESAIDLKAALSRVPLGSPAALHVQRAGARVETTVVVQDRRGA